MLDLLMGIDAAQRLTRNGLTLEEARPRRRVVADKPRRPRLPAVAVAALQARRAPVRRDGEPCPELSLD